MNTESQHPIRYSSEQILQIVQEMDKSRLPGTYPPAEISRLIPEYAIWVPSTAYAQHLFTYTSYCDFRPGEPTTILTKKGKERSLEQIARNYLSNKTMLPPGFVEYIENMRDHLRKLEERSEPLQPILIIEPADFFQGNMLDGVHRTLAYLAEHMESGTIYDPGIPSYIGTEPKPSLKRMLRPFKQRVVKQWRIMGE